MKFNVNDIVEIINENCVTYGWQGNVVKTYTNGCDVRIDDGKVFYYRNSSLNRTKDDNKNVKKEKENMYITGDFKVAKIKFLSGNNTNIEYEYAMFDDCEVGDTVVVASAHHGLGIAKISAIIDKDQAHTKKFEREIVCKVDMEPWENRKKNRARLQELNNRMEKRAQEINKLAVFEMMAEKDESLKEMLEEYKALIK